MGVAISLCSGIKISALSGAHCTFKNAECREYRDHEGIAFLHCVSDPCLNLYFKPESLIVARPVPGNGPCGAQTAIGAGCPGADACVAHMWLLLPRQGKTSPTRMQCVAHRLPAYGQSGSARVALGAFAHTLGVFPGVCVFPFAEKPLPVSYRTFESFAAAP